MTNEIYWPAKIRTLEEVDGASLRGPINILKELTGLLPRDTWLSSLTIDEENITIDGYSDRASLLLITMGKSALLTDFAFEGPIDKTSEGKERFRINFRLKEKERDHKERTGSNDI